MSVPVKPEPLPAPPNPASPSPAPAPANLTPPPSPAPSISVEEAERMRRTIAAQDAVIKDGIRAQQNTAAELQKLRGQIPAPVPVAKDPKDFFNKPYEEVAGIVKKEVAETIAPLMEMLQQINGRASQVDKLAEYKKQYPTMNWDRLEPAVNAMVEQASQRGVTIDKGSMDVLVLSAIGLAATGQIEGAMTPAAPPIAPPPSIPVPVLTPPHLQPSVLPAPAPVPAAGPVKPLTENEARLARERKWTPEQYRSWENIDPSAIVSHKMPGEK